MKTGDSSVSTEDTSY